MDSTNKDIILHGLVGSLQLVVREIRSEINANDLAMTSAQLHLVERMLGTVIEVICTPPDQVGKYFAALGDIVRPVKIEEVDR